MKKSPRFFTLFFVDERFKSISHNLHGSFERQLITFLRCCQTLNSSLKYFTGSGITVLTNNESFVRVHASDLMVKEINFTLELPEGVSFFASHHKIDVFKYFADANENEYMFLLDNDIICVGPMPVNLISCIHLNHPVYYDVTSQVYPANSREVIQRDKQVLLDGSTSYGMWAGGEFLGGDKYFFRDLRNEIDSILPTYLEKRHGFHHQSDEMLVSVALEKIKDRHHVVNAGVFGGIARYWSVNTLHVQASIDTYKDHFLLHLPADKEYLANVKQIDNGFFRRFKLHLLKKRMSPIRVLKELAGRIKNLLLKTFIDS